MTTKASGALLARIQDILRPLVADGPPVYLIGGAVRDLLLKLPAHDLDFAMPGDVRRVARRTADALDGAFYMLDDERSTARVIFQDVEAGRFVLDFAALRADTLEGDLRARDFTINAIAIDINKPNDLIDPLGGAQDLKDKCLRMCTPQSFEEDPLRVLRGVRQALSLQFRIVPETWAAMGAAAPQLVRVSMERKRDEVFRMAEGRGFATALQMLDHLGVLEQLFPEAAALEDVALPLGHTPNVWEHTLSVVRRLEELINVLVDAHKEDDVASLHLGLAATQLHRFRPALAAFYAQEPVPGRSLRGVLKLAAALHDIGKTVVEGEENKGRLRFPEHAGEGSGLAAKRGSALTLSKDEATRIKAIIESHMQLHALAKAPNPVEKRDVYCFFKFSGAAGVDVCLLSLADIMAAYGPALPLERWQAELDVVEAMLAGWFEQYEQVVSPPRLVTGKDLMRELGVRPGRRMGALLDVIEETQACGEILEREQALAFARKWLEGEE